MPDALWLSLAESFSSYIKRESDIKLIEQAYFLAKEKHEGQMRKSGEPYITHPIAVAKIIADLHGGPATIIASLLHDTVEDTTLSLKEVDTLFGSDISQLVDGVTKLSKIKFQGISLSHMYDGMYENLCHFDARPILEKQFYAMHSESMASSNISSQKLRPMVSVSWEVLGGEFVFLKHRKMGYAGGGYGYSDGFGYGSGGGGMGQMSEFHKAIVFKDKAIYTIRATMKTPEGLKFEASMELDTAKKYDEFGDRVQASILLEGSNFYVNEKIALTAKIEIKDEALHEEDLMFMWMVRQPAYYNESQYDPTAPQESGTQYELENENSKEAHYFIARLGQTAKPVASGAVYRIGEAAGPGRAIARIH